MPTSVGPNIFGEENLVFGYDLGDVSNSYRGEPTTNLAGTNAARTIGFHNQGAYGNAGSISDAPEKGPGWKKITVNNRGNNSRIAQFPYTSLTAGITYSYSLEVDMGTTSGYYWRIDGSVGYGAITIQNNKVVRTITPSAGVYAIFLNHNTTGVSGISEVIYYRYYQVEQNSHTTQFTEGTRSSTQGLLDLKGNSTIDLANVSFDSNAQKVFDGTDDYIEIPNTNLPAPGLNYTLECVFQRNSGRTIVNYGPAFNGASKYYNLEVPSSVLVANVTTSVGSTQLVSSTTISSNIWYHGILTYNASAVSLYINGVLAASASTSGSILNTSTPSLNIGRKNSGNGEYINGKVGLVKIYSRALTAQEVSSNFNAVKTRFNL